MRLIDADDFLRGIAHDHSPAAYWVRRLIEQARTIAPPPSSPAKPLGGEAATGLSRPEGGARLDRRRWEGCPVCAARGCETCLHRSHDKSQYPCRDCAKSDKFEPDGYCSSCGKPQMELAWAELERRIGGSDGEKDHIYCMGWIDPMNDEPIMECRKCPDYVDRAEDDRAKFYGEAT